MRSVKAANSKPHALQLAHCIQAPYYLCYNEGLAKMAYYSISLT